MKTHLYILCISGVLLLTIGYTQILHRIVMANFTCKIISDCSEEPIEKSSEEISRETDQDDDPFRMSELTISIPLSSQPNSTNERYFFGLSNYFPEIVSPPPQA